MRISDWSSDVCSSDLKIAELIADGFQLSRYNPHQLGQRKVTNLHQELTRPQIWDIRCGEPCSKTRSSNPRLYLACLTPSILSAPLKLRRSEEHTSELQSLMRISYAVFCLKKKKTTTMLNI